MGKGGFTKNLEAHFKEGRRRRRAAVDLQRRLPALAPKELGPAATKVATLVPDLQDAAVSSMLHADPKQRWAAWQCHLVCSILRGDMLGGAPVEETRNLLELYQAMSEMAEGNFDDPRIPKPGKGKGKSDAVVRVLVSLMSLVKFTADEGLAGSLETAAGKIEAGLDEKLAQLSSDAPPLTLKSWLDANHKGKGAGPAERIVRWIEDNKPPCKDLPTFALRVEDFKTRVRLVKEHGGDAARAFDFFIFSTASDMLSSAKVPVVAAA